MSRSAKTERWTYHLFPLTVDEVAESGEMACIDTSSGEVVAGQTSTTLLPIGAFAESVDNTGGSDTLPVNVELDHEIHIRWWANDPGAGAVAATDVGSDCYILDSKSVTMTSTGASKAGRVWAVDSRKGVAVEVR